MNADTPSFLHRPNDMTVEEAAKTAEEIIKRAGGPARCSVYFKFTCMWCGARCTFNDANTCWQEGECAACGKTTKVTMVGMTLHFKLK